MMHMGVSFTVSVYTHGIPCLRSRLKQGHASIGSWAIKPSRYRSNGNWAEEMRHWHGTDRTTVFEVKYMKLSCHMVRHSIKNLLYCIYSIILCLQNTPLTSPIYSTKKRILSVTIISSKCLRSFSLLQIRAVPSSRQLFLPRFCRKNDTPNLFETRLVIEKLRMCGTVAGETKTSQPSYGIR